MIPLIHFVHALFRKGKGHVLCDETQDIALHSLRKDASQLCSEFVGTLKTRCLPALCIGCIAASPSSYRSVVAFEAAATRKA